LSESSFQYVNVESINLLDDDDYINIINDINESDEILCTKAIFALAGTSFGEA
jgi:hypothetical protein